MRHDPTTIRQARTLRKDMTPAERILWRALRGKRFAGFRFRRQHPIDPFIVDFYCPACQLIVELDGETHLGREAQDLSRTLWLQRRGNRVLQFWNTEVFEEFEAVLEVIYDACRSPLTPAPSPRGGEGEQNTDSPLTPDCRSPLTPDPSPPRGEGWKSRRSFPARISGREANPVPLSPLGRGVRGEGENTLGEQPQ